MKAQWDEGGGRILLGDNANNVSVKLLPVRSLVLEVWVKTKFPLLGVVYWNFETNFKYEI